LAFSCVPFFCGNVVMTNTGSVGRDQCERDVSLGFALDFGLSHKTKGRAPTHRAWHSCQHTAWLRVAAGGRFQLAPSHGSASSTDRTGFYPTRCASGRTLRLPLAPPLCYCTVSSTGEECRRKHTPPRRRVRLRAGLRRVSIKRRVRSNTSRLAQLRAHCLASRCRGRTSSLYALWCSG
jgi:hypothetical protein